MERPRVLLPVGTADPAACPSTDTASPNQADHSSLADDLGKARWRLNIPAIESALKAVQENFVRINHGLSAPRDVLTDQVCANMVAGYRFIDEALAQKLDLFEFGHSRRLLELNTLVLCGTDEDRRRRHARHIAFSEHRFYEQPGGGIGALMEWLQRHGTDDIWTRSAGAYIQILSRPQLYLEGNHRAGALIMSYMLAREGQPPFVLSVANAKAYFDPSNLVKGTNQRSLSGLLRLPKLRKRFAELLKEHADERYLISAY